MKTISLLIALTLATPFLTANAESNKSRSDNIRSMESIGSKDAELIKKFNRLNTPKQQTLFMYLFAYEKTDVILKLIRSGFDVNFLYEGMSPLHAAIELQNLELIQELVRNNADLELRDKGQETALKSAVRTENIEILEYLIAKGSDVNTLGKGGTSPLTTAAYKGNKEVIELLVKHGANLKHKKESNDWTLLHFAAEYNHVHLIDYLVSSGIKIDSRSKNGWSSLAIASEKGNVDVVKKLIRHSADIELPTKKSKSTPLMTASFHGHTDVVMLLLEAGADVERKNNRERTPLWLAARESHSETATALIKVVSDPNETFLRASAKGDYEVVRTLIKSGIDVKARTKKGSTAMHLAAKFGHLNVIKLLQKHGADIHAIATLKKDTPLMRAAGWGKREVIDYLIEQGAKVDIKNNGGWTAALSTARHHRLDTLKLLIKNGADIHQTTNSGWTILMVAVKGKKVKTIEYLLKQDLDLELKNNKGKTALDLAIKYKNKNIIEKIKKAQTEKTIITST